MTRASNTYIHAQRSAIIATIDECYTKLRQTRFTFRSVNERLFSVFAFLSALETISGVCEDAVDGEILGEVMVSY